MYLSVVSGFLSAFSRQVVAIGLLKRVIERIFRIRKFQRSMQKVHNKYKFIKLL
jgi:hypothetical protein